MKIVLPYKYTPREYQLPFWRAMVGPGNPNGKRRAYLLRHRRAGKDKDAFNYMVRQAFERIGVYYYFFPSYAQGRKALWDNVDRDGMKFLDHIPKDLMAQPPNQTEMKVFLKNGSLIQVVGSDNIDTVVGSNPVGVVFSEYSLQDPSGYNFVRPILRENGGWAVFTLTPRGSNHAKDLYDIAKNNDEWYVEKLTIDDTWPKGGTVSPAHVEEERQSGMSESLIQQEFFCSFDAAVEHAVFGKQFMQARSEGRITTVPYQKGLLVNTYWDIGRDTTAIWFEQSLRNEVRLIDYHQAVHSTLDQEIAVLQDRGYVYGVHYMPHDADYKDYKTGTTPKEVATELGLNVEVLPKTYEHAHIDAARMLFNRCWFDEKKCEQGLAALQNWSYVWDEKTRSLSRSPAHDWACFVADTKVLTKGGIKPIANLSNSDEVLTPCGWKRFEGPRLTKRNAELVEVEFADGHLVRCTPEHLFLTDSGWKFAKHLTRTTVIRSTLTKSHGISMAAFIACGKVKHIFHAAAKSFIEKFGPLPLVQFPITATSITKMVMSETIVLKTSNAFQPKNIYHSRLKDASQEDGYRLQCPQKQEKKQTPGTDRQKGDCSKVEAQKPRRDGKSGKNARRFVRTVKKLLLALTGKAGIRKSGVQKNADWLTLRSVKEISERQNVYCINVPDAGCFSLANGAVVSNSHGAKSFCYVAVGHEDEIEWRKPDRYARKNKKTRSWMTA